MATRPFVTDVVFGGYVIRTTVTSSGMEVDNWLRETRQFISADHVVGIDVEWRTSYGPQQNPVALLQLCVGRRCLIFQLLHADFVPGSLNLHLADPSFHYVGVGVQEDVARLAADHALEVSNAIDLRSMAADEMGMPELRQAGLQDLARTFMGVNHQKPWRVRMSPWDVHSLSNEQIIYACIDAFVSFEIGRMLFTGDY